jgi:hypothetical protein
MNSCREAFDLASCNYQIYAIVGGDKKITIFTHRKGTAFIQLEILDSGEANAFQNNNEDETYISHGNSTFVLYGIGRPAKNELS